MRRYVSVITMMEIKCGIENARKESPEFSNILETWYKQQVKPTFENHIIPVDLSVAECSSVFSSRRTRSLADSLIAATAHVYELTLATRNTADFSDLGIKLVNPWKPQ
ncbi:MAG: type II toxin-antitoxin system VapC family toxin [Verrucomicrobia bacterium]|nr:type II toxin-antitoxin system VapC family toxin [Verrucomicrobiota bacterium]